MNERAGARLRTYNSSMTTRNKRCIRLVSLDSHKTLTPLIASKLRVSRVTAHHRSEQVPGFFSLSVPRFLSLFPLRMLHIARRNGRRDNHRDIVRRYGLGSRRSSRARDVPSYFHPTSSPRTTSSRDNFHKVVSASSELSFLSYPFSSSATATIFQSLFESQVPFCRSNLVTSV